jgi:hypothetical protein
MGHIARRKTEEHVRLVKDRIELLSKVIPSPGTPMRPTPYLLKHEVFGWNAMIEADFFKEHGCLPTGDSAIATRTAYATEWLQSKAPDDVRKEFLKEYEDYKVSLPNTRTYSFVNADPSQKDFGLVRETMLNVGTLEDPYPGGKLGNDEREMYVSSLLHVTYVDLTFF